MAMLLFHFLIQPVVLTDWQIENVALSFSIKAKNDQKKADY